MREIRFRAWDNEQKRMVYGLDIQFWGGGDGIKDIQPVGNTAPLMQYTGLKDKNGKEIYEGDILDNPAGYPGPASIVKWNDEGAYFHIYRGDALSGYTLRGETSRHQVIGNIYENPNLIK